MLRFVLLILLALPLPAAADQTLRQFSATVGTDTGVLIRELQQRLPDSVQIAASDVDGMISYAGTSTPPALLSFLTATFPNLNTEGLAPGRPVVVGLTISQTDTGGQITALVQASFPAKAARIPLPPDATLLMDTDQPGSCNGQQILSHPTDAATATETYHTLLKNHGYTADSDSPQAMSFFIGRPDSCAVILYVQPDPDSENSSLIVLRFLED